MDFHVTCVANTYNSIYYVLSCHVMRNCGIQLFYLLFCTFITVVPWNVAVAIPVVFTVCGGLFDIWLELGVPLVVFSN